MDKDKPSNTPSALDNQPRTLAEIIKALEAEGQENVFYVVAAGLGAGLHDPTKIIAADPVKAAEHNADMWLDTLCESEENILEGSRVYKDLYYSGCAMAAVGDLADTLSFAEKFLNVLEVFTRVDRVEHLKDNEKKRELVSLLIHNLEFAWKDLEVQVADALKGKGQSEVRQAHKRLMARVKGRTPTKKLVPIPQVVTNAFNTKKGRDIFFIVN